MPFTWTMKQTYMQMTITLGEVAANVPVDASRFARPRWRVVSVNVGETSFVSARRSGRITATRRTPPVLL